VPSGKNQIARAKKWGSSGTGSLGRHDSYLVSYPIYPSFPLRGRWERSLNSAKQAPSPSLWHPSWTVI